MTDRDGGIAAQTTLGQQHRQRLAGDHRAIHDDHVRACGLDLVRRQESLDPERCAGDKAGIVCDEAPDVLRVEPVDVFLRIDVANCVLPVDVFGDIVLDQDPVDCRTGVELSDRLVEVAVCGAVRGRYCCGEFQW